MDSRRLAYLDAMGIDVWLPRGEVAAGPVSQPRIQVGEGRGDLLCIARDPQQASLQLAADISGAMRNSPVWAWPADDTDDQPGVVEIGAAVADGLFTRILVFGAETVAYLFGADCPEVVSTARVHVVPGLDRLGRDREAKRELWSLMLEEGIAAPRKPGGGA